MKTIFTRLQAKLCLAFTGALLSTTAFSQIDVLVCGAVSDSAYLNDVQTKLMATGSFNSVQNFNIYFGTPTLSFLQGFDAVLSFTDYSPQNSSAYGDTLAAYIDGGGGVVSCVFQNASVPVMGRFDSLEYQVVVWDNQTDSPLTLGDILLSCHPTTFGITSFDGGASSYRSTSDSLAPGAQFTAEWSDGTWLIAVKEGVGASDARRADLNFYPPSSAIRSDFWIDTTQGAELMENALLWVANELNAVPPAIGPVTGQAAVCAGDGGIYAVAPVSNAVIYAWSVPAGTQILSGQGTTSISITAGNTSGDIMVAVMDSCGSMDTTIFPLTINVCTGIQSVNNSFAINVYPNPNDGVCTISIANASSSTLLEIVDLQGKVVYSENMSDVNGNVTKQLDLSSLAGGAYFLKVTSGTEAHVQKIFRN
jgi:hypothetical protein